MGRWGGLGGRKGGMGGLGAMSASERATLFLSIGWSYLYIHSLFICLSSQPARLSVCLSVCPPVLPIESL